MCSNVPQLSWWIVALLHSHSWTHTMSHSEVVQLCVTPRGKIWHYRSSQSFPNYQTIHPKCWRHNQNNTLKYIAKFWRAAGNAPLLKFLKWRILIKVALNLNIEPYFKADNKTYLQTVFETLGYIFNQTNAFFTLEARLSHNSELHSQYRITFWILYEIYFLPALTNAALQRRMMIVGDSYPGPATS